MNIEEYRDFCLSLPAVTEAMPFDQQTLVFKVCNKIFALTDIDTFKTINLKCEPERAIVLREQYPAVTGGYHMNKKHWNTIAIDGSIPTKLLQEWIKHSYDCVVASLPKKIQNELNNTL